MSAQDQKESFDREGLAVFPAYLTPDQTSQLVGEIDRLGCRAGDILRAAEGDVAGLVQHELIVVPEASDPLQVCRYESIAAASGIVRELVAGTVRPLLEALLGEPCHLFKDKLNEKSPGGGAFTPHQDFAAYRHFAPRYNATVLLPIDRMTELNGYVYFSRNYRSAGMGFPDHVEEIVGGRPLFRTYGPGPRNGDIIDEVQEKLDWEPVAAEPGDVIVFDSFIPHFSRANHSTSRRRALFLTFNRAAEGEWYGHYYRAKRSDASNPMFHVSTPTGYSQT